MSGFTAHNNVSCRRRDARAAGLKPRVAAPVHSAVRIGLIAEIDEPDGVGHPHRHRPSHHPNRALGEGNRADLIDGNRVVLGVFHHLRPRVGMSRGHQRRTPGERLSIRIVRRQRHAEAQNEADQQSEEQQSSVSCWVLGAVGRSLGDDQIWVRMRRRVVRARAVSSFGCHRPKD